MNRGAIEQIGTPEEVYLHPRTRFVASFLGAVNWVNGVGLRPEVIRVARIAPPDEVRAAPATVESSAFLGNSVQLTARMGTGDAVMVEVSRLDGAYHPGDRVHLWWQPGDEIRLAE
jgi:ABC-type Fe3+/spermidine/putrescine transport system ATPase subunit